jgi:hypothetical protein
MILLKIRASFDLEGSTFLSLLSMLKNLLLSCVVELEKMFPVTL